MPTWEGYNRFYKRFDATALPEEITRMTWSRFFDENDPYDALVAEDITAGSKGRLISLAIQNVHGSSITIGPI